MKKFLFLSVLVLLFLTSCENDGINFKSIDDQGFTTEEVYMIDHADSTILMPAIVGEDYIIVISNDWTQAAKLTDISGDTNGTILYFGILIGFMLIMIIVLASKL